MLDEQHQAKDGILGELGKSQVSQTRKKIENIELSLVVSLYWDARWKGRFI
jgi:hypothetical protein